MLPPNNQGFNIIFCLIITSWHHIARGVGDNLVHTHVVGLFTCLRLLPLGSALLGRRYGSRGLRDIQRNVVSCSHITARDQIVTCNWFFLALKYPQTTILVLPHISFTHLTDLCRHSFGSPSRHSDL